MRGVEGVKRNVCPSFFFGVVLDFLVVKKKVNKRGRMREKKGEKNYPNNRQAKIPTIASTECPMYNPTYTSQGEEGAKRWRRNFARVVERERSWE